MASPRTVLVVIIGLPLFAIRGKRAVVFVLRPFLQYLFFVMILSTILEIETCRLLGVGSQIRRDVVLIVSFVTA